MPKKPTPYFWDGIRVHSLKTGRVESFLVIRHTYHLYDDERTVFMKVTDFDTIFVGMAEWCVNTTCIDSGRGLAVIRMPDTQFRNLNVHPSCAVRFITVAEEVLDAVVMTQPSSPRSRPPPPPLPTRPPPPPLPPSASVQACPRGIRLARLTAPIIFNEPSTDSNHRA